MSIIIITVDKFTQWNTGVYICLEMFRCNGIMLHGEHGALSVPIYHFFHYGAQSISSGNAWSRYSSMLGNVQVLCTDHSADMQSTD